MKTTILQFVLTFSYLSGLIYAQEIREKKDATYLTKVQASHEDIFPILRTSNPEIEQDLATTSFKTKPLFIQSETHIYFESGMKAMDKKYIETLDMILKVIKKDVKEFRSLNPYEKIIVFLDISAYASAKPFYTQQPENERKEQNLNLAISRAFNV